MNSLHIQHLYLRAGFGIGYQNVKDFESKSKQRIIDSLFINTNRPAPLDIDLSELIALTNEKKGINYKKLDKKSKVAIQKLSREKVKELNYAWFRHLQTSPDVLREKMTLFWANVFVCRDNNVMHIQQYNNTLRKHALGDFRAFVKAIAREASMSNYLNNKQNVKENPNENFARELMELFTLGVEHFTETDVKEAARAFTGWSYKFNGDFYLRTKKHDYGQKQFMGETGNFDGDDIIDIILNQKQTAKFICAKVYKYFVNPKLNNDHVEELATLFYKDYNINTLMRYIFNADWFYDPANIGVKIKSPIELLLTMNSIVPYTFEKEKQLFNLQKLMGQVLLFPPNVAGWKGDTSWIDANSLMLRLNLPSVLLNNAIISLEEKGDFEDSFEDYYKRRKKGNQIKTTVSWTDFEREYGKLSSEELKKMIVISHLTKETDAFLSQLKLTSMRDYCIQLMSIPEYQLC
ncbi:DUF1800 domain-containing protein [Pseudotamlana carrageenivorans]|uniref:DUF1800 domain-containing protein n=1 Tax=Pseudotamlana carrageenivorans TaxID=2069432 RepID=A0A2I7SK84_9FLAO|nr:DUF1800 domain-containing protein [Tamlana carrageenivorans]AUS06303.1 DUF1800 domain-containing protein [Tamlana carrageenivorans]